MVSTGGILSLSKGSTTADADSTSKKSKGTIVVLGSGPIRIGQGIEFDYASVQCVWSLKKLGYEVAIVNNNPETVSTDFDTADRLYFEPLTPEDVMGVINTEKPLAVVVAFGGGTAIKLANFLSDQGIPILGTSADAIDLAEDRERFEELCEKLQIKRPRGLTVMNAEEALNTARKIAQKLKLNMNLIEASYTFERNQLIFFFLSDQRVDFRDMAKELASIYKTRIELRQIGVRDKAREVSGIGQCGRVLCCASYMKNFVDSVSMSMAKNQNLALSPSKINGQCGRLLWCLTYEDEVYTENRKEMPSLGEKVETEKGTGTVVSIDILKKIYVVDVPNEGRIEVTLKSKCDECEKCN